MVTEGEVLCGYRAAWQHFVAVTGELCISVGRGRRYWSRAGASDRRRTWLLDGPQLERGLWCSLQQAFAMYGDVSYAQSGVPTGGITSRPALGLALGHKEFRAGLPGGGHMVFALRYVDDLLLVVCGMCSGCVEAMVQGVYGNLFSSAGESEGWVRWLDQEYRAVGSELVVRYRHAAKKWVAGRAAVPERASFLPYLGALPTPFSCLRGIVLGRLRRLQILRCSESEVLVVMAEACLELLLLGYPQSVVRAVAHSLPSSAATVALRSLVRALPQQAPTMPRGAGPRHAPKQTRQSSGQRRVRKSGRRQRSRSPSSSSSSDSSGYKAYKAEKQRKRREMAYRTQGAALASALDARFASRTEALGKTAQMPYTTVTPVAAPAFPPAPPQAPQVPQVLTSSSSASPSAVEIVQALLMAAPTFQAPGFAAQPPRWPKHRARQRHRRPPTQARKVLRRPTPRAPRPSFLGPRVP